MKHILVFLLVILVVACEHQVTDYSPQPAMTKAPYLDRVIVYRHWVTDVDDLHKSCPKLHQNKLYYGCADLKEIAAGEWVCHFYIQQPKDFNDVPRLAVGGHEVVEHCFGAEHEDG